MNDLIKKSFLDESEVLLKSEMVTLVGGENFDNKDFQTISAKTLVHLAVM